MAISTNTLVLNGLDVSLSANRLELFVKQDNERKKYLPSSFDFDMIFSTALTGYVSIKALNWLSARKVGLSFYQANGQEIYTAIPAYAERNPHIQIKQFKAFTDGKIRAQIANKILKAKYASANKLLLRLGFEPIATNYKEQIFSKMYWERLRQRIREYGYDFDTRKGVNRVLNRHATNIVNATLNLFYGYAESKIALEIAKVGLNPHISFLHQPTFQKMSLTYDIIEYIRADIDDILLKMLEHHDIKPNMFYVVQNSYFLMRDAHICVDKLQHLNISGHLEDILRTFDNIQ